jgi:hypothetical protein
MSILDKYLVKSQYLRRIIPTNALTEIPILSASSSKIEDNSFSKRNDLVTVDGRVSSFKSDLKSAFYDTLMILGISNLCLFMLFCEYLCTYCDMLIALYTCCLYVLVQVALL